MNHKEKFQDVLGLEELAGLYGLPTLIDLLKEGLEVEPGIYRAVAARLLNGYLKPLSLHVTPWERDTVRLGPFPGQFWRDAAYLVGNLVNLIADRVVIDRPERLIEGWEGENAGEEDFKRGVLAHLRTIARWPEVSGAGEPVDALRRALDHAAQVNQVRKRMVA